MSKLYIQKIQEVLMNFSSVLANEQVSGSAYSSGYSKLIGQFLSSASANVGSGSGLHILQSSDYGTNWDVVSASYPVTANAASSISVDIYGNAVMVVWYNGQSNSASARIAFGLRPI